MKKNELKEARAKNLSELKKDLAVARQQLAQERLKILSGKSKNTRLVKSLRRNSAQLQTLISEKSEGAV